jgi:NAD(P)-dependent dehydrogenase (short-subunit alcohol dehydrogenase family)
MGTLKNKVALVTGAGQGVGLGIAQAFADAGANLVITGRDAAKLETAAAGLRAQGAAVLVVPGDSRERASARAAIAATLAKFGRLDVLVNNAQSSAPGTRFEDIDDATIDLTMESGFYGTLYHMQEALAALKVNGGSVINLGSREGIFGGIGMSVYAAGKEAIRGLSRSTAREWGPYGIRVNVICPAALSPAAVTYLDSHPNEAKMYLSQIALGRFGDPRADIAPVAVFLASDEARYVTGQTLNVEGGMTML